MNKRGQGGLTSRRIVITILALAGFVVVIYFLLQGLDLTSQSEDEICRLSVLTRATSPDITQKLIPLKCTTKKICLTTGGGNCDDQFLGEKNIKTIKLPKDTTAARRKIEEVSANAMYDCWSIMGQGKLDLFSEKDITNLATDFFAVSEIKPTCVICSRIALANDLQDNKEILKDVNINRYIENEQIPGSSLTYLQAFTDRQIRSYSAGFSETLGKGAPHTTNQMAFIFSQIQVDGGSNWQKAINTGATTGVALGGTALFTPAGRLVTAVSGGFYAAAGTIIAAGISGGLAYLQAEENQGIAATHCQQYASSEERARQGCSIVMPIDYNNIAAINQLCNRIEGNP